jgi:hypothetical protein
MHSQYVSRTRSYLPNTEGIYSSSEDRLHAHGPASKPPMPLAKFSMEEIAYRRYGFIPPQGRVDALGTLPSWQLVTNIFGSGLLRLPQPVNSHLQVFASHLLSSPTAEEMPRHMYDAFDTDKLNLKASPMAIDHRRFDGEVYYLLWPKSSESTRVLALTSAVAVLQIVRLGLGQDMEEVMESLLDHGITFNTLILRQHHPQPVPRPIPQYSGLGYRPKNYVPDEVDYRAYELIRRRLLQSNCGRAALLMGGIVARLARDDVQKESVYKGPSDSDGRDGVFFSDGQSTYWDNRLTDYEVDIICGVYCVDTGKLHSSPSLPSLIFSKVNQGLGAIKPPVCLGGPSH